MKDDDVRVTIRSFLLSQSLSVYCTVGSKPCYCKLLVAKYDSNQCAEWG